MIVGFDLRRRRSTCPGARPLGAVGRLLLVLTALGLSLPARARALTPNDQPPSATPAPSSDLSAVAKELYGSGRYLEAARAYELLWREGQRPGSLFNAGMAREAAGPGNDALAIQHWRRYLEVAGPRASAEERADLERRIAAAEERTVVVELARSGEPTPTQVDLRRGDTGSADALVMDWQPGRSTLELPLDVGEWTIVVAGELGALTTRRFTVARGQASPLRIALVEGAPDGEVTVHFGPASAVRRGIEVEWEGPPGVTDPGGDAVVQETEGRWTLPAGRWTLRAKAPGFALTTTDVDVDDGPVEVELGLRRDAESRARIGVAAASGVVAAGMLVGGGVIIADNRAGLRLSSEERTPGDTSPRVDPSLEAMKGTANGIILVGAGGGAGIVAVTVAGGGRERALATEAVIGGLAFAGGLSTLQYAKKACPHEATTPEDESSCFKQEIPVDAAIGLGAGVLGASTLALISRAVLRSRARAGTRVTPGVATSSRGLSLSLSGRF